MHISLFSLATILLILQTHSNNACNLPGPSLFNIENYNYVFLWKIMNCTIESKESADKALQSALEIQRNVRKDFYEFTMDIHKYHLSRFSKFSDAFDDLLEMNRIFENTLVYYQDTIYKEYGHAKEEDILEAKKYFDYNKSRKLLTIYDINELRHLHDICKMGKSERQFLHDILKIYQYINAQIFTIVDILNQVSTTKISANVQQSKSIVNYYYQDSALRFKFLMKHLSGEFYICGSNSVTHNNSIELKAFQKYLFSTDQFETNDDVGDCRYINNKNAKDEITCKDRTGGYHKQLSERYPYASYNHDICLKTKKCNKLYCASEGVTRSIVMCLNPHSENRYHSYNYGNHFSGKKCTGELTYMTDQAIQFRTWAIRGGTQYYPLCDCICMDNDYYISTQIPVADILEHKVVVGSRFKMLENTLYIEILQGKLLPNGSIDAETLSWKNASNLLRDIAQMRVKLDWNDVRSIDLTTTKVPKGSVVVGLGFIPVSGHKQRLGLRVMATAYDFVNGRLKEDYYKGYQSEAKKELQVDGTMIPQLNNDNRPMSKDDEFITFTTSHTMSGGQNTVPFIDAQPVVPSTLKPLSGAGLFYKSQENSAGFIGFKLIEYDPTPDMEKK